MLDSWLSQTYDAIEIRIYDNGASEGHMEIQEIIRRTRDKRIRYVANPSQVGAITNYARIFSEVESGNPALVLASDQGLDPTAVEKLMMTKNKFKVSIVCPNWRTYDARNCQDSGAFSFLVGPYETHTDVTLTTKIVSSAEIIQDFYSEKNIDGEYYGFTIFGSLIDGFLFRHISPQWFRFRWHGAEQFLAMTMLLSVPKIALLAEPVLYNIVNNAKLGGTKRPDSAITRRECIAATQMIIETYGFLLESYGLDTEQLRRQQILKAQNYLNNFRGGESYIHELVRVNSQFLSSEFNITNDR